MLDVVLILTFTAHLLAVNVATGSPFLALWCEARETRHGDALAGRLGRNLARLSVTSLGVGVVLGIVTLGLLWSLHPQYLEALRNLPSRGAWLGVPERIWSGLAELAVFAGSMWAYRVLWDRLDFRKASHRWAHRGLGWFAGLNILYHLPTLFAIAAVLNERPELMAEPQRYFRMLMHPEVAARVMHTWLAAFAISGVAVLAQSLRLAGADEAAWAAPTGDAPASDARRMAVWGARMALAPTVLQVLAGTWLTFQIPDFARRELMGGDLLGSGCFAVAVLASVYLMHNLAGTALGDASRAALARSIGLATLVVLLMVTVRHRAREATLRSRGADQARLDSLETRHVWASSGPQPRLPELTPR